MQFLTDFADQAVLLPLALSIALIVAASGWGRGAAVWALTIAAALAVMLALKLTFQACGHLWPGVGLASPSGHTAAAAIVYGGLAALWRPGAGVPAAVAVALLIGASRLALGMHTPAEVALGGIVGVTGVAVMAALLGAQRGRIRLWPIVAVALAILLLCHGRHLPAEDAIRHAALYVRLFGTACASP